MCYKTSTKPRLLNSSFNFSNTKTHFQILDVSIEFLMCLFRILDQTFVSKHILKTFKHSAELCNHLKKALEHLKNRKTESITHVVESTVVVFPTYPETNCQ